VNAAMYDASQGANSGAHVSVITESGTNAIHGQLYDRFQNSDLNAAPFFYNADPAVSTKDPFMNRNQFGATLGGPIKKDKLFYFVSYQGIRVADSTDATKTTTVPLGLTNDRSAQGIVNMIQSSYGDTITASQISPAALSILPQLSRHLEPQSSVCAGNQSDLFCVCHSYIDRKTGRRIHAGICCYDSLGSVFHPVVGVVFKTTERSKNR